MKIATKKLPHTDVLRSIELLKSVREGTFKLADVLIHQKMGAASLNREEFAKNYATFCEDIDAFRSIINKVVEK